MRLDANPQRCHLNRKTRARALTLLVAAVVGLAGCSSTGDVSEPEIGAVEVRDFTGQDGADAAADLERDELEVTVTSSVDGPSFDSSRDLGGCIVTDQDPSSGTVDEGDEVALDVDCRQVDWSNREGDAWERFGSGYSDGFNAGCEDLFSVSPDGSLYEDDIEYGPLDCQNLEGDPSDASEIPEDVPDDPEDVGLEAGTLDGCQALFEQQGVVSLNYGENSVTQDDCPVGDGTASAAPTPPAAPKPKRVTKSQGDTCLGEQEDGSPILFQIEKGEINCAGAEALWNEWLRRAPTEGVGSGAFVEFEGWGCVGAPAAQTPRAGTCEKLDGSAEFTGYTGE